MHTRISRTTLLGLCLWLLQCGYFSETMAQPRFKPLSEQTKQKHTLELYRRLAEEFRRYEQYAEAGKYYRELTWSDPNDLYSLYHLAECNRLSFNYPAAESEYGKVYYSDSNGYPNALFYYALMQKRNGKYAHALQNFNVFLKHLENATGPDKEALQKGAEVERDGCHLALHHEKYAQRDFALELVPAPVSSPANDYGPILYKNDSSLIIASGRLRPGEQAKDTRLGEAFSDFYRFQLSQNAWQAEGSQDDFNAFNTKWNEGTGCFNRTGDKYYFTGCSEPDASCKIYVSTLKNGQWGKAEKLNKHINPAGYNVRHPALSLTGDTLFFVSDRPGGAGMNDIWMSLSAGGDNWSPPSNLRQINTPLNELSPFMYYPDQQFFFASEGHTGLGGLDIYVIKGSLAANSLISNLGPPFNSSRDDAFFVLGNRKGYLASNRTGGLGNFDILSFNKFSRNTTLAAVNREHQDDKPDLSYLDNFQFEYLSGEDKLKLDRMVSLREAATIYRQDVFLTEDDLQFYQRLSLEEKERLNRIVVHRLDKLGDKGIHAIREEDAFAYEKLPLEEKKRIERFIGAYQLSLQKQQQVILDDQDQFHYRQLSSNGKRQLDRLIATRMNALSTRPDSSMLAWEDTFTYEKLPLQEQERINRIATERIKAAIEHRDVVLTEEDEFFYSRLSPAEKEQIERAIQERIGKRRDASDAAARLEEERFNYERLSDIDKDRVNRMAAARHTARMAGTEEKFSDEDNFHYTHLSDEDKNQLDRLINSRLGKTIPGEDTSALEESTEYNYQKIAATNEKHLNKTLVRPPVQKIQLVEDVYGESNHGMVLKSLNTFQLGQYKSLTVRGELYHVGTNEPARNIQLSVVNDKGDVIKTTHTNPDGSFTYVDLSLDENYRILIETPPTKLTDEADYYIENLELITSVKEAPTIVYEPVHFDFGKDQLTAGAKSVLNGLVAYFQRNPTIQIELNAYTDKVGRDSYNLLLSQRRGEAVREYLLAQGLPVSGISVKAHGKRNVPASKHHSDSLDRSVEFTIRGAQQSATNAAEMVVISAQTSLKVLAEKFAMSLEELQDLNGFIGEQIEPYRPIKIKRP